MYDRVIHCWDTNADEVARLRDQLDRSRREVAALRAELEYTLRHGGPDHRQAILDVDPPGRRQAEGRSRVIREMIAELRDGYRYPDQWNGLCREYGMPEDYLEPEPRRRDRVVRALCWAATEVGDRLAARLDARSG